VIHPVKKELEAVSVVEEEGIITMEEGLGDVTIIVIHIIITICTTLNLIGFTIHSIIIKSLIQLILSKPCDEKALRNYKQCYR